MNFHFDSLVSLLVMIFCFVFSIVAADAYGRQQNVDRQRFPSADELLDRHIEAIGGEDALRRLKSIKLTGTLENNVLGHTFDADLSTLAMSPDKFRLVVQHPRFSLIRVANGNKAWGWRSGTDDNDPGTTDWLPKQEAIYLLERAVFNPELNHHSLVKSHETIGVATIGNRKAFEVRVTNTNDEVFSRFFDAESGRLTKIVRTIQSESLGEHERVSMLCQYEEHGGIWIPMRLEHTFHIRESQDTQVHSFSKVEINGDVNSKLFEPPAVLLEKKESVHEDGDNSHHHKHPHDSRDDQSHAKDNTHSQRKEDGR